MEKDFYFISSPYECFDGYSISARFGNHAWKILRDLMPEDQITESFLRSVDKRKSEYLAVRHCAFEALTKCAPYLNHPITILNDQNRAPVWPKGIVGSMTHTFEHCSAIVDLESRTLGVGIDSERVLEPSKAKDLSKYIVTVHEQNDYLVSGIALDFHEYLTLVFSAKESLFKALNPIVRKMFDFMDARILDISLLNRSFSYELLKDLNAIFKKGYYGRGEFRYDDIGFHTYIKIAR